MTEIRIFKPENNGCPIIIFHEDMLDNNIKVNLKFENYELDYGRDIVPQGDPRGDSCACCGGQMLEIPFLTIKDGQKEVFKMDFNKHWLLNLQIKQLLPKKNSMYEISFWITNMDDGDTCEVCENNRFHFEMTSITNHYSLYHYSPPKGPFMEHPPDPKEELDETVLEGMK